MSHQIIKTISNPAETLRLHIIRRDDGLFGFIQEKQADDDGVWTGVWIALEPSGSPICDSAEAAEREAESRVEWLIRQD
jgi:hypothetical protein